MIEVFAKPTWELGVPIKSWVTDLETGAFAQAVNLANLPFVYKHIALMPDAHQGYGMPIGGVMATEGVVVPNAVGVDIGCGVCVADLGFDHFTNLREVMTEIRKRVPVGFKKFSKNQLGMKCMWHDDVPIVKKELSNAQKSIGTLGGGNHFIEFQRDEETNNIHLMVHSGSRNLGNKVATHYNQLAIDLNHKYFANVPPEWQLAFLPLDSEEGKAYMREMTYCVDYAYRNRNSIMDRIIEAICEFGYDVNTGGLHEDISHNYARFENHFGKDVMIHRKGAIGVRKDQIGIIPGSQGTKSYIVKGLGHPDSFQSSSHGAGRQMGRKQAQKLLDLDAEVKKLDDQGIIHSVRTVRDLDEASGAYKDIHEVMENQKDLVTIERTLLPLAVIKG